jgi:alpha-tubulin suppressor-like RCC1 family protein
MAAGGAKCWGANRFGQLGNNSKIQSRTPVDVVGLAGNITSIDGGFDHSCARIAAGGVKCWGQNYYGALGINSGPYSSVPVDVNGLASAVQSISAGDNHTCVRKAGGVKCWGENLSGELGNNSNVDSNVPVDVAGLTSGAQSISAGQAHTCAVTVAAGIKCWGWNGLGQLGNNSTADSGIPVEVSGLTSGAAEVSAGSNHTCARTAAGGAKCWGSNSSGQLGNNSMTSTNVPVGVFGLASGVEAISSGAAHTCALMTGGGVKCWGYNLYGQLGNNSTVKSLVPVDVSGLGGGGALAISSGAFHTCAHVSGGGAKCWGNNQYGQLGDNSTVNSLVPIGVSSLASGVQIMAAGYYHTCTRVAGGGAKCWGHNEFGQLGNGSIADSHVPIDVSGLLTGVLDISPGRDHTCALVTGGGVKCWGYRTFGQLGDGSFTYVPVPVDVVGFPSAPADPCPGPTPNIALANAGANGYVFCGANNPLTTNARAPGVVPDSVTAVFWWSNANQQFKFWFRGFPNSFQTLTSLEAGKYYFFQVTTTGGTIANTGGAATLAASGAASFVTLAGANGAIWSGGPHATNTLAAYASITPVTAIFSWNNGAQQFNFWFRGFPDNFQTLTSGIERGKYYFFQAPAAQTIPMN